MRFTYLTAAAVALIPGIAAAQQPTAVSPAPAPVANPVATGKLNKKGKPVMGSGLKSRFELQLRAILVLSLNLVFRLIGEGASDTRWDSRSIIGIAKND